MRNSTLPASALPLRRARTLSLTRVSPLTCWWSERLTVSLGVRCVAFVTRAGAVATGAAARAAGGAWAAGAAVADWGTVSPMATAVATRATEVRRARCRVRAGRAELLIIEVPQVRLRGELSGSGRGSPGRTSVEDPASPQGRVSARSWVPRHCLRVQTNRCGGSARHAAPGRIEEGSTRRSDARQSMANCHGEITVSQDLHILAA